MTVLCFLQPSAFTKGFTAPAGKERRCIAKENMLGFSRHLLWKHSRFLILGSEHFGPLRANACAGREEANVAEDTTANQEAQGGGQGP